MSLICYTTLMTSLRSWVQRSRSQRVFSEVHFSHGAYKLTVCHQRPSSLIIEHFNNICYASGTHAHECEYNSQVFDKSSAESQNCRLPKFRGNRRKWPPIGQALQLMLIMLVLALPLYHVLLLLLISKPLFFQVCQ